MKLILDLCQPRKDVLSGQFSSTEFAADLAAVLRKEGPESYRKPDLFFANTYPTRGLRTCSTMSVVA